MYIFSKKFHKICSDRVLFYFIINVDTIIVLVFKKMVLVFPSNFSFKLSMSLGHY